MTTISQSTRRTNLYPAMQALKGLTRTLARLTRPYALKLQQQGANHAVLDRMSFLRTCELQAVSEIMQATTEVNGIDAWLSTAMQCRVLARIADASLDERAKSNGFAADLHELVVLADAPVWTTEEMREAFRLCFQILGAFGDQYQSLIGEVRGQFPEETREL